jgi:hypothetical protein
VAGKAAGRPAAESPRYQPEFKASEAEPVAKPETKPAAVVVAKPAAKPETRPATAVTPEPKKTGTSASAPPAQKYEPEFKVGENEAKRPVSVSSSYTRISDAKRALKEKKLSKDEFKKVMDLLEKDKKKEIDQAKRDLKADKINKKEYKDRVDAIEKKYK